ncbi:hypothetical protein EVAR_49806_1 [Eumeta japonica]|uniref:Uncharacterized protein n=1 Tax=Eumeta variegata TaxID=151549 RepID=A0A4C1XQM4_EUMVA|nr:hypothetical protein EVAR_49806_1 [Eumeta japonica]
MDIYDFQSWQYNHSDELAKQMFAHQALGTPFPYRGTDGGAVMPVPTGTPWNMQGIPWGMPSPQPSLVQFTAPHHQELPKVTSVLHSKRKPVDIEPAIPAKQLITEEKMAAHLSGLHISLDFTSHGASSESSMEITPEMENNNFLNSEQLKGVIVLSDEIKNLKDEPLIPAALIERLEKPCMSLVVWEPKKNVLDEVAEDEKKKESEELQSPRRNGVLVPEHSIMDVEM